MTVYVCVCIYIYIHIHTHIYLWLLKALLVMSAVVWAVQPKKCSAAPQAMRVVARSDTPRSTVDCFVSRANVLASGAPA